VLQAASPCFRKGILKKNGGLKVAPQVGDLALGLPEYRVAV